MTADKEEVIDFVAPYYEQTGITIGNFIIYYFLPETIFEIKLIKILCENKFYF